MARKRQHDDGLIHVITHWWHVIGTLTALVAAGAIWYAQQNERMDRTIERLETIEKARAEEAPGRVEVRIGLRVVDEKLDALGDQVEEKLDALGDQIRSLRMALGFSP